MRWCDPHGTSSCCRKVDESGQMHFCLYFIKLDKEKLFKLAEALYFYDFAVPSQIVDRLDLSTIDI